ncbi:response regulator [Rubellimicrobium rubrum]|uniref:Response regulator n=1 Tax=Rubellimicrobium rubrum TaxID=2585369 RepID=A0A5C4N177_9RHOB|nr:response regulator [Rubellimicrobium rubrum]TNC52337.1 response regulator [Rubellimicrobium rubrum]
MPERSRFDGAASSLRGERVLVVEDEYMLAQDLRADLERRGAAVVGPVSTVAEALDLLGRGPAPSMAILDINLQGEMSYPVAEVLRASGIPFLFATGYEPWAIPDDYADVPRAEKPIELGQALQMLGR